MKIFKQKTLNFLCRIFCYLLFHILFSNSVSADENNPIPSFSSKALCTTAKASWDFVEGASQYRLKYSTSSNEPWQFIDLPGSDKSYSAELLDGVIYVTQLEAFDSESKLLASSTERYFTTGNFLLPPIFDVTTDSLTAQLTWSKVEGATGYRLFYKGHGKEGHIDIDANTFYFSADLWEGAFHQVVMKSKGKGGEFSDISPEKEVLIGEKPDVSGGTRLYSVKPNFSVNLPVFPAVMTTPYKESLEDCLYSVNRTESCTFDQLPMIGQRFPDPTIDDIMEHLLVSKPWMADRLRQILEKLPAEALKLFKPVTGVVISGDIRASHYKPATGALYINPAHFWFEEAEKEDLPKEGDHREGCGDRLSYAHYFMYQRDGKWVWKGTWVDSDEKNIEAITVDFASVLFHELIHANDFFPSDLLPLVPTELNVSDAAFLNASHRISDDVSKQFPLHSLNLKRSAQIKESCQGATCLQLELTPQIIADDFAKEATNSLYGFWNSREDIAVIGEEVLMSYFLNTKRLSAIIDNGSAEFSKFPVYWGIVGFKDDEDYRNKAKAIMSRLVPEIDFATYIDDLPAAHSIPVGQTLEEVIFSGEKRSISKHKANTLKGLTKVPYH